MSDMTSVEKRKHISRLKRKKQREQQQLQNKKSPWIYVMALIIALLVLYIVTQNK